ncbi:ABC transporter substrate-binding protein [Ramlibacter sp. G-1-2-2]|uniref:ABC transporter substrate-binding protein n=1 Tax=Ramlibacter agri TaxID=2728837 RepID=A0A848H3Z3_9BURK|nr:ABC transporter substrate-binding protein [Ramlibacter agri]NML44271.1 ABC transporter substrate-binding protein [Ramlibacter agri]
MRGRICRHFAVLVYLSVAACGAARAEILLGTSSDYSSANAALTRDYMRGMQAYLDEVNRKGGIRGETIRIVSADDGSDPQKTAENTRKLVDKDEVLALVAYRGTAGMLKIVPIIQAAGVPEIGSTSMAKALREPAMRGVFHMRPSTADEIEAAVNHAWTIGMTRIAAYYQDDAFGNEAIEAFRASLAKRGAQPVAVAALKRGSTDVASGVDALAKVQPQAVLMLGQTKPNAALIKGLRAKDVHPMFFALSVSSGLHAELNEAAAGIMVTQVAPYPFIAREPVVTEYQSLLADKHYSYGSLEGFLNAKLVVRALQKTPSPITRAKLMATLESMGDEDLGGFHISYGKQSNLGSRYVNLTMIRQDGTFAR